MSDRKAVIKNADMSEEMQQDAVDCATQVIYWLVLCRLLYVEYVTLAHSTNMLWITCYNFSGTRKIQYRKGYSGVHQEGVRQKVQPNMALHCWEKLRIVCNSRNPTFHLFLSRASCHSAIQKWIIKKFGRSQHL